MARQGQRPRTPVVAVARYAEAWDAHDPDACARCFAPGGARVWCAGSPLGGAVPLARHVGRESIVRTIAGFMDAVPDLRLALAPWDGDTDGVVWAEWWMSGIRRAAWGDDPGAPAERVLAGGLSLFRIVAEDLAEERVYWDPRPGARPPLEGSRR